MCVCLPDERSDFQDCGGTICSPWHKSLSSGASSSSLTSIFYVSASNLSPFNWNPLTVRPATESHPVIEEISLQLKENHLGGACVYMSINPFIHLRLPVSVLPLFSSYQFQISLIITTWENVFFPLSFIHPDVRFGALRDPHNPRAQTSVNNVRVLFEQNFA